MRKKRRRERGKGSEVDHTNQELWIHLPQAAVHHRAAAVHRHQIQAEESQRERTRRGTKKGEREAIQRAVEGGAVGKTRE